MDNRNGAKWIWLPHFQDADPKLPGKFVLFRKSVSLPSSPTTPCLIHVSADTRYRLYVNGVSVAFGPCKSYPQRWFYETIDITPHLHAGTNVIAAKVLRFFPAQTGSTSMMKANVPGFILWGEVGGVKVVTDENWLCHEDESIELKSRAEWNYILGPPFLSLDERVDLSKAESNWHSSDSCDLSRWKPAVPAVPPVKMMPVLEPWKLHERPIPLLPEVPQKFVGALRTSDSSPALQEWTDLLLGEEQHVVVQAGQTVWVEIEASTLTTGFLEFDFSGGTETEVAILYAESYEKDLNVDSSPFPLPRLKGDRRDWQNGRLYGNEDHVVLHNSDSEQSKRYEPFWFRTFRFIRLSIVTQSTPLTIRRIAYRETHYPLEITTKVDIPAKLNGIWDTCIRTLKLCMHETYEDCPFYEQNQFAMDGRLQLLFTYQLSRDDRLARKTIHEFYASRRDDGLLETNYPVSMRAINIPQFSLFWVLMLHDHMMHFGDKGLVRRYIGGVDGVFQHFEERVNRDGLVGAFDEECWAFVDWVQEWQGDPRGPKGIREMAVPPIYKRTGVAAYNSLLYAMVLQRAAELCMFIAREDTTREYRQRADALNEAVVKHCFNGTFFVDGPGAEEICEHTQVFAILSGATTGEEATRLMQRTMEHKSMPRCSYATKFYVFRALSKTGLYEDCFKGMMQTWYKMSEQNLTTFAEDDVGFRSDCHGWSASPIYEIVAELHGVRPARPGFGVIDLRPRRKLLEAAQMRFSIPKGVTSVQWEKDGGIELEAAEDIDVEYLPPGARLKKIMCTRTGQRTSLE
ncbi:hypothetical protein H2198_002368 [Neophaeococcomyces mojaviensis]|uniref:Uncharacterized protein n=1 Tax=Neophaeococcomyces mojaviensis TaxID=3383035 RepID=A0ACC3AEL1_9EURO|nr:hypothetical protein H2198_002368 [Knufia sp. JES_112]